MSVQFRSRVKSGIDYSTVLNGKGTCCDLEGNKTEKSFYDCFNDGGNFYPGITSEVICPSSSTEKGCCCACSFVDNLSELPYPWNFNTNQPANGIPYLESGVICNIARCECERIGGKFTPSEESTIVLNTDNWQTYCLKDVSSTFGPNKYIDARYPRSCCSISVNTDTGWLSDIDCINVCYPSQCASSGTVNNPSVYSNNSTCGNFLYSENGISNGLAQCTSGLKLAQMTQKDTSSNLQFGSCYELELSETTKNYEYTCNVKTESDCIGYWTKPELPNKPFCGDKYTPTDPVKVNNKYQPQIMTQSNFNSLKLQPGMKYQGGIYIGIFEPGTPINPKGSKLYGDLNFNNSIDYYADNIGVGGQYKKWALIVDLISYVDSFIEDTESDTHYETSLWDGYYNTYGNFNNFDGVNTNLFNTFRTKPKNGFIDYYIPSIHEMHFYAQYLKSNSGTTNKYGNFITSSIFSTKYINDSTNKVKVNNHGMVYGLRISNRTNPEYKTILIPKNLNSSLLFFRRIAIDN